LLLLSIPLAVRSRRDGRDQALARSQVLGRAILAFHLDTGVWPVNDDVDPNSGEISRLVGLPAGEVAVRRIPGGDGLAGGWRGDAAEDAVGALADHLIQNRTEGLVEIYPRSTLAPDHPGWNGPYLREIPLDPWGHPYVCNTRYLEGAQVRGVGIEQSLTHAVFCLSAGPNEVFETPLADDVPLVEPAGDDLGWPIQLAFVP
jgi:hypothetical protein